MADIRLAQAGDIPQILALTALWAVEPSTTGHYNYNTAEQLQGWLGGWFWVAEQDGAVVGFLWMFTGRSTEERRKAVDNRSSALSGGYTNRWASCMPGGQSWCPTPDDHPD